VSSIVLQLLLIPIVVQRAGLEANGKLLTALSISVLFSILINFASNQSGPRALSEEAGVNDKQALSALLSLFFYVRLFFFFISAVAILVFYFLNNNMGLYLVGTIPLLIAELFNPYVLCLTRNQLQRLSILNLAGRLLGLTLVYFFWQNNTPAYWVNAWVGASLSFFFLIYWVIEVLQGSFQLQPFAKKEFFLHLKENSSLVLSNGVVHFQQAFFLYLIGFIASPMVLGIYAIIDKIIWGCRTLLISFSGAVYAASLKLVAEGWSSWNKYKVRVNKFLLLSLLIGGLLILALASPLALLLGTPQYQQELTQAIRLAACIPLFTGLNLMNVLELLLKKKHQLIYRTNLAVMAMVVLLGSVLFTLHYLMGELPFWIPVIALGTVELITLVAYEKSCRYTG
jgi:O-antigen/teichoic acid export membrane protein